ncbi:MAG: hypothetical protein AUI47_00195 [Acidobacteria bacterium 13_1_40CM_2_68_5]|nr:MAG: hypothetical protein AUI47_00195 [Acidobacteria bacterium 13_1_40CM_2_68_5]
MSDDRGRGHPGGGSSAAPSTPGRAAAPRAWLRPGFTDLLGIFLALLVVIVGAHRMFGDADGATHVATGLWILDHRRIPGTDPFSGTAAGAVWFAHEWLADVASALAYRVAGCAGLLAGSALVIVLAHVLLFRFLVRRGDDVLVSFGAVVAAAATASSHWLARPHLLTVLFLVVWTVVLEQVLGGRWRPRALLGLPPLALVWANVHGGFLVAFIVLACYTAGTLIAALPRGTASRPGAARARSLLTPVNPWGWRLPRHLLSFFARRGPALRATAEFAPAALDDRAGAALLVYLALVVAGIVGAARAAAPGRSVGSEPAPAAAPSMSTGTLLALGATTAMAFVSIRHVEVMVIFGTLVIASGFSRYLRSRLDAGTRAVLEAVGARDRRCGGGALMIVLATIFALAIGGGLPRAGFDPRQFPVGAVAALKESGRAPDGPVFTPDFWGGYLLLEWPQARVFVDGRWDMYGDAFFERYAGIYLGQPGWSKALREAGVTLVVLPREAPLARTMQASADWALWRSDETALVFRRLADVPPEQRRLEGTPTDARTPADYG